MMRQVISGQGNGAPGRTGDRPRSDCLRGSPVGHSVCHRCCPSYHHGGPSGAISKCPKAVGTAVRRPDQARCTHRGDHTRSSRRSTGVDRKGRAPPQASPGPRGGLLRPGSVPVQQLRQRWAAGIPGGPAGPDRETAAPAGRARSAPAHQFGPHSSPPAPGRQALAGPLRTPVRRPGDTHDPGSIRLRFAAGRLGRHRAGRTGQPRERRHVRIHRP